MEQYLYKKYALLLTTLLCIIVPAANIIGQDAKVMININDPDSVFIENIEKSLRGFSPKQKVDVYLRSVSQFLRKDLKKAEMCNEQALNISMTNNFEKELACSYLDNGTIAKLHSNYLKSIEALNKAIVLFEKINDQNGLSRSYRSLGDSYTKLSEFKKAMQLYTKALNIAEKTDHKNAIVEATSSIANVFIIQGNYKQALIYLQRNLESETNDRKKLSTLNSLGAINAKLKNFDDAIENFKLCIDICAKNNNTLEQAAPLANIGVLFLEQKKPDQALEYFNKAVLIQSKFKLKKDLTIAYLNIGVAYKMKKEYDLAISYSQKAMRISKEEKFNDFLFKTYFNLASLYEDAGNCPLALENLYHYINESKEAYDLEKNKQIQELLAKYEADSKEKELKLLKKDKKLKEAELKKQQANIEREKLLKAIGIKEKERKILLLKKENEIENEKKEKEIAILTKEAQFRKIEFEKKQAELKQKNLLKNIAIGGSLFILAASIVLVVLYQQRLKALELLNIKTEEVNKQKVYELMRDQEFTAIKASMEGQEKERARVAKELHDGIGGNLASIKLSLANIIKDHESEKLRKVMTNLDETYNEVRAISHNLLPSQIVDKSFVDLIKNITNEILSNSKIMVNFITFPEKELNLLPNDIKVEIYRVIQELTNNILKHSKAENIEIQLIKREQQICLMVEDDGVGFDINKQANGIGLTNIKSRIEALNGTVNIESVVGKWTIANIEMPV